MFFDSFRRKWMLDVLTWFLLENTVFFEVFDEINHLFRSFLEEKSDFRCLWYPYGTPRRPKRYHKLQKERFCSRKERLGIQKSLFFRTKSLFFGLMVPLWYQMRFRSASFGTIRVLMVPLWYLPLGLDSWYFYIKWIEKRKFS